MTLSNRQKLQIVEDIELKIGTLNLTSKPRQKMQIIEEIDALLAKLFGGVIAVAGAIETLFQQITKGVHDALGAMGIFAKIKAEVDRLTREIISGDSAIDKQLHAACIHCANLAEQEGIA